MFFNIIWFHLPKSITKAEQRHECVQNTVQVKTV
jgi:hypothetical protein